jgi:mannan endo-1,4-beta-mannosidase
MYGATVYNPGLTPYRSGLKDPTDTIALAKQAHLNTIRITDFLDKKGDPQRAPYDENVWQRVDSMISAAGRAGLRIDLSLADFRAVLWNNCANPYTADWTRFVTFVANRVNTVTGQTYKNDPTIAFVSIAGEPLPVGSHPFSAKATGQACTITYTTTDLTNFYRSVIGEWQNTHAGVLINTGGLGYLNESHSGIDWKRIFALPGNAFCGIKTYGGMQAWAPTAGQYCASIGKPLIDEEFGWQQQTGDDQRAALFEQTFSLLQSMHAAGSAFWNLGYEVASNSYEVSPSTPKTFAVIVAHSPDR